MNRNWYCYGSIVGLIQALIYKGLQADPWFAFFASLTFYFFALRVGEKVMGETNE